MQKLYGRHDAIKCLNPNCQRIAKTRGLCASCYGAARSAIIKGQTSWAKLIKTGRCQATRPRTSGTSNWLLGK